MNEKWKDIEGYEGLYQVSDLGRVRSLDRKDSLGRLHKSQIKTQRRNPQGYPVVDLFRGEGTRASGGGGKGKTFTVHRLVAKAFLGDGEGMEVCHLDGSRDNNRVENLVWGSVSDNRYDAVAHGTHSNASKTHCLRGHLLEEPNLTKAGWRSGVRGCKACNRARATLMAHPDLSLGEVADTHYHNITGENRILYRRDFL